MDFYTIKATFSDGNVKKYEVHDFGVCGAMHEILTRISEYEEHDSSLVSLEVCDE